MTCSLPPLLCPQFSLKKKSMQCPEGKLPNVSRTSWDTRLVLNLQQDEVILPESMSTLTDLEVVVAIIEKLIGAGKERIGEELITATATEMSFIDLLIQVIIIQELIIIHQFPTLHKLITNLPIMVNSIKTILEDGTAPIRARDAVIIITHHIHHLHKRITLLQIHHNRMHNTRIDILPSHLNIILQISLTITMHNLPQRTKINPCPGRLHLADGEERQAVKGVIVLGASTECKNKMTINILITSSLARFVQVFDYLSPIGPHAKHTQLPGFPSL